LKKYLILILLSFSTSFVFSQDDVWTLERCIDYALKNNIEIKQSGLQKEVTEARITMSKQAFLPDLNFTGDHVYFFGRSIDPTTNTFNNTTTQTNTFSLSSNIDLFTGLSNFYTLKKNKLELEAISLDQENLKNEIQLNIAVAYLNILQSEEQLKQAKIQVDNLYKQKEMVQIMAESGVVPEADAIEVESAIINQLEIIENFEFQLKSSLLNLKNILQLPFSENFQIQSIDDVEIDTSFHFISVDIITQNAINWHPSIKSFFYKNQTSELDIKIAKSNYIPRISMFGGSTTNYSNRFVNFDGTFSVVPVGFSLDNPFDVIVAPTPNFSKVPFGNQLTNNISYVLGLRLSVPIYNKGEIKNAVTFQKINQKQNQYNYESSLWKLQYDIEQKVLETKSSFEQYKISLKGVTNSASSYVVASERYKAGIINIYEFINAQNNFFISESRLVQQKYKHIFNQLIIDYYNGEDLKL
jgi:outer membrane protein